MRIVTVSRHDLTEAGCVHSNSLRGSIMHGGEPCLWSTTFVHAGNCVARNRECCVLGCVRLLFSLYEMLYFFSTLKHNNGFKNCSEFILYCSTMFTCNGSWENGVREWADRAWRRSWIPMMYKGNVQQSCSRYMIGHFEFSYCTIADDLIFI